MNPFPNVLCPAQAFLNPESVKDRYTTLIALACTPDTRCDVERALIAYRLADATLKLPATHARANSFSSEILSSHQQVVRLIHSLLEPPATAEDGSSDPAVTPSLQTDVAIGSDTCDLCDAPIPFTDLNMAACLNGHQFPRCGLSFLAIQAPKITKSCGICETQFLSEEFVRVQEEVEDVNGGGASGGEQENGEKADGGVDVADGINAMEVDGGEVRPVGEDGAGDGDVQGDGKDLAVSLAKILYLACDVCIYCGGKFVG